VRLATPEDLAQEEKNRILEQRALQFCQDRVDSHKLPIYLVQVECLFDASKIVFYFNRPRESDFRELVKDLVQEFRTASNCGRSGCVTGPRWWRPGNLRPGLCCAGFLRGFRAVSVRMAKEQQLSLNPIKSPGFAAV